MTPKDKAKELVSKHKGITGLYQSSIESAIVTVDEILHTLHGLMLTGISSMYWQEVKRELENYDR